MRAAVIICCLVALAGCVWAQDVLASLTLVQRALDRADARITKAGDIEGALSEALGSLGVTELPEQDRLKAVSALAERLRKRLVVQAPVAGGGIRSLTPDDFVDFIEGSRGGCVIGFFAPWCGHCKRMKPDWAALGDAIKTTQYTIAEIDASAHSNFLATLAKDGFKPVNGFPTIRFFDGSLARSSEHTGARTAEGLLAGLRGFVRQPIAKLASADAVSEFLASARNVSVFAFADATTDLLDQASMHMNARAPFSTASITSDAARAFLLESYLTSEEVGEFDAAHDLLMVRGWKYALGSAVSIFTSDDDLKALVVWIRSHGTPVLSARSEDSGPYYAESGLPTGFLYVPDTSATWHTDALAVANAYRGRINIIYVITMGIADPKLYGLNDTRTPSFAAIQFVGNEAKWAVLPQTEGERTYAQVTDFIDRLLAGNVTLGEVPGKPASAKNITNIGALVEFSSEQWTQFFGDLKAKQQKLVVMFYAPWCGHCKKLEPTMVQVADFYARDTPSLVIARYNAHENQIRDKTLFPVKGYPTVFFFDPATGVATQYQGARTFEALHDWIDESGSFHKAADVKSEL